MAKSRILTEIRGRADRFRTICGVELSGLSVLLQMLPVLVEIGQSGRPALGIVIDFPSGISGKVETGFPVESEKFPAGGSSRRVVGVPITGDSLPDQDR